MERRRGCGVLLHPTSLPGRWGVGDLGPAAHAYVDWLADAGVGWWQMLPVHPAGHGECPYAATSTFAGNPLLISPDVLVGDGLVTAADLADAPKFPDWTVDFERVGPWKLSLLRTAWRRAAARAAGAVAAFAATESSWLADWALFAAVAEAHGTNDWRSWPEGLALRDRATVAPWRRDHADEIAFHGFCQMLYFRQWRSLRRHAAERGVRLFGDLPVFVPLDSADVWAHRELFRLDATGDPTVVAGVPPDYFSATGQRWGNPLYDWQAHRADGYRWWSARLAHAAALFDLVRVDHFRGFAAFWEIAADAATAEGGRWVPGPGRPFFEAVREQLGELPLVAEDLGEITPDVIALRRDLGLPGMAVLQFAFSPGEDSCFLPHNHTRDLVVYTGTHDNNTTVGWWLSDADEGVRDHVRRYLPGAGDEIHWALIRAALASVADLAVVPHQDLVGLGSDCRMNTPGVADGNWRFRLTDWMLDPGVRDRLAGLIRLYGRGR